MMHYFLTEQVKDYFLTEQVKVCSDFDEVR